jgi:hypothetical protein
MHNVTLTLPCDCSAGADHGEQGAVFHDEYHGKNFATAVREEQASARGRQPTVTGSGPRRKGGNRRR